MSDGWTLVALAATFCGALMLASTVNPWLARVWAWLRGGR